jgi:prepilin-type N-terminal cleavage/methylation domain-containing protein
MPRRSADRAFTLVELLVVVAIIAIVIAILLPSLSTARAQANRTRCLNNIRQIGVGLAVYVHDFGDLPPATALAQYLPLKVYAPAFYAERRSGLLALRPSSGFQRFYLSCPQGWNSGGDPSWYQGKGVSPTGAAYMDYAYWANRYPTADNYDVLTASFTYRRQEKATKILVTDVVVEQGAENTRISATIGYGNHVSNHDGPLQKVQLTNGRHKRLPEYNIMRSAGSSALFSDYHAEWFSVQRLTQRASGLCYPPPDQW